MLVTTTEPRVGQHVRLALNAFIARNEEIPSREVEGEVVARSPRALLLKGTAVVRESANCLRCGREITDPVSRLAGYGPVCSDYLGIPRAFNAGEIDAVRRAVFRHSGFETWLPLSQVEVLQVTNTPASRAAAKRAPTPKLEVDFDGGRARIRFPYEAAMVAEVKQVPGARWNPGAKEWTAPEGDALLAFLRRNKFPVPDARADEAAWIATNHERLRALSRATDADLDVPGLGGTLRPFQRAAVKYASEMRCALIGDEMGLGKTVEALATLQNLGAFPAIVVCPASLKLNWQREAQKWLPGKSVEVLNGKVPRYDAAITIINYDILGKHADALIARKAQAIVFDESHYLKSPKAKRSKEAARLAREIPSRFLLTGTAVLSRPIELVHQLDVLGKLDQFGGFWGFAKQFTAAHHNGFGWDFSGASNLDQLNAELRARGYIRREKHDVLPDLPPKQRSVVPLPLSNRGAYDDAEHDLIAYLRAEVEQDQAFRAEIAAFSDEEQRRLIRARQQEVAYRARAAEHLVRVNALKQLTARGKLDAVVEWIEQFRAAQEKLVVFAHHQEIVETLAERFDAPYVNGSVSIAARDRAVERFQTDPECLLIVLNLQAGGVGLTLTAASNVAFVELPWTPALLDQAEDRCHRIGQQQSVNVYYLLAAGTIDEQIGDLLDRKRGVVEAALIDGEPVTEMKLMGELVGSLLKEGVPA